MGEREATDDTRAGRRDQRERLGQASGGWSEPRALTGARDDTRAASRAARISGVRLMVSGDSEG
jgi:hypothetical protein